MVAQDDITSLSREAPLVHTSIKPFSQIALVHIQIGLGLNVSSINLG